MGVVKICVYGAGAVGGYLAVLLARAGADVSAVARGPHLTAIRERGLCLLINGERLVEELPASDAPATLGKQDVVIIALKAHSIAPAVAGLRALLHRDTVVVSAVNGIPWWYFHALDSPFGPRPVRSVDPEGAIWNEIGPQRAIGCVVYPSTEVTAPGVVKHLSGDRLILGEPSGKRSERVVALAALLLGAGFKAPVRRRIRDDIWTKLLGNLAFNPLSALTHATLDVLASDPGTRAVARAMMTEGKVVGEAHGARFAVDIEKRMDGARAVGPHRTSMLQDLVRGRPLETGAVLGAVRELGELAGVATPTLDMVDALIKQRAMFR